jgi:hypothetical protein
VQNKESGAWSEQLPQEAASSRAAVRAHLNGSGNPKEDRNGMFVAVPSRSWNPVKVETKTALKFS